ncbi:MAG: M23 family metallopeptidase [Patescibacteria group bacterium]|nr:M23 family metallopeptidase [Patescibacteria group bacterium]
MKFPTKYNHYGYGWLDKISQGYHPGIDYNNGAPYEDEGQEVIAITNGQVKYAGCCSGWGWHVLIHHPEHNIWSHYAHLQNICVKDGDNVLEGQLIGLLGGTGGDWPPHLHFEIRLKDFHHNKYVTGMSLEVIKDNYANPEQWLKERNAQIPAPAEDIPVTELKQIDPLTERLKGRILLQAQSHHEAWYVNPVDRKRYYLKDGEEALKIMKKFGLGITNADLEKIKIGTIES